MATKFLRCSSRLHGVVVESGRLEIKCKSPRCGAAKGIVVLHYFDLQSGEMVDTKRYQDPERLMRKDT